MEDARNAAKYDNVQAHGRKDLAVILHHLHGQGGADKIILAIARKMASSGHRVRLMVGRISDCSAREREVLTEGLEVIEIREGLTGKVGLAQRIGRLLSADAPDAILATKDAGNLVACLAAAMSGVSSRVVVRQAHHFTSAMRRKGWPRRMGFFLGSRLLFHRADLAILVSRALEEDLVRVSGLTSQRCVAIPNPVDAGELERLAGEPRSPKVRDLAAGPLLLAAGRLTEQKGFDVLLRAVARVRADGVEVSLVILGEGEERDALEGLRDQLGLAAVVHLPGYTDNPYPWFRRADLFVLSSRYEGLPNVLIEALTLGLNVVATDCPTGPREILEDGRLGRLVPINEPVTLAEAIKLGLTTPLDSVDLKDGAVRYELSHVVGQYEEALFGRLPAGGME